MAESHLYGLVMLIQCRGPYRDDSLIGTRLRGSDLEHFTFDAKLVLMPVIVVDYMTTIMYSVKDEALSRCG